MRYAPSQLDKWTDRKPDKPKATVLVSTGINIWLVSEWQREYETAAQCCPGAMKHDIDLFMKTYDENARQVR